MINNPKLIDEIISKIEHVPITVLEMAIKMTDKQLEKIKR